MSYFFVKKCIICVKTIFVVLYHFSNFWKKKYNYYTFFQYYTIICAENFILREKNFHGKKCYNMF